MTKPRGRSPNLIHFSASIYTGGNFLGDFQRVHTVSFGQTKREAGGEIAMFRVGRTLDGDFRQRLQVENAGVAGVRQGGADLLDDEVSMYWGGRHVSEQPGRV